MRLTAAVGSLVNVDWLYSIRQARGFVGHGQQAAVAAQNSHVQLLNPVGSGRTVIVHGLIGVQDLAGYVYVRLHDPALATLLGNGVNLAVGGAASVAELRATTNVGILGTPLRAFGMGATLAYAVVTDWFVLLAPGKGVLMAAGTLNNGLGASYEWIEL